MQVLKFMSDPLGFMQTTAAGGAQITRHSLGPKNFVFVFNPEAAQEILVKRAGIYAQNRTIFDRIQPVTGKKGLVQLSGIESQQARAKSRPMFSKSPMEEATGIITSYTQELIDKLSDSATIDITETMTDLILRTALRIFLGIDSKAIVAEIGTKFLRLNHLCGLRMRALMPMPLFIPTSENREIKSLQSEIRELITKHVSGASTGASSTVPKVFQGDESMIDHCMTFLFAGHETTAASLAFTFLLLAKNPDYQDRISSGDDELTLAVYKESLRLYPPAYMLAREALKSDELLNFKIKKSDQVFIAIASMHRNTEFFERPDAFYPERFLEKLKHPFAFIPFGAGAKSCVGERLAYLEASIILKMICQKFYIIATSGEILVEPLITLHPPKNQHLCFKARKEVVHV